MWSRVHKVDRVRPQPGGGAIVLIEDERSAPQVSRSLPLSTLIAIARVLDARQVLDAKYAGKGEVRYAAVAALPIPLSEAIARAGASVCDRTGERVLYPTARQSVEATVDVAFAELAHTLRGNIAAGDLAATLARVERDRAAKPLDKDAERYWPSVFEIASLAGELARGRGGRWIEVRELPVPFALKFPDGSLARPLQVAQQLVEGQSSSINSASDGSRDGSGSSS